MRILYAIQGTGNGHLSRARDIIPILQKKGELDLLVSGIQADVDLPYEIKYRFKGLSFIFGKRGGIDLTATYRKNRIKTLLKEIEDLPVHEYDLIINDFEPVSAWACKLAGKACIGLSHQAGVINTASPKPPGKMHVGRSVLNNYAPVSASYGFHFEAYAGNIFTPVIRQQIRAATPANHGHYTVYLPAYSDKRIIEVLSQIPEVQWEVFSKHSKVAYRESNIQIQPVNNEAFINSFINAEGVLCGAGFETPAEALYLEKKLMLIPMSGQYEQQCNAFAAEKMGVAVIKTLKSKNVGKIREWTGSDHRVQVYYPDITEQVIDLLITNHYPDRPEHLPIEKGTLKHLKKLFYHKRKRVSAGA